MEDRNIVEIASAIHVQHIVTPISDVRPIVRSALARCVKAHLDENLFDFAPVWGASSPNDSGAVGLERPDGFIRRIDLEDAREGDEVGQFVRSLSSDVLIGAKASINELIDRFRAQHVFMLVVGSRGFEGVVTPSDLNKQAGRTHLFMQVSALEMALAEVMRETSRSMVQTLSLLPFKRASLVRGRYERQMKNDEAADLITAFDMQDLLHAYVAERPGCEWPTSTQIERLSRFRNGVMHAVGRPASDDEGKLRELLVQTSLVSELLSAVDAARVIPVAK